MPVIRRQGKRAQRPRPLSEAEERENIALHLRCGHGYEHVWHDDADYLQHHRELTVPVLRRHWAEHRDMIMKGWRWPDSRPWAWWMFESPAELRAQYLGVFKREQDEHEAWLRRGCTTLPSDCFDDDDDAESLTAVQERLLRDGGFLDADENDSNGITAAALSCMQAGDAGLVPMAELSDVSDMLSDTTTDTAFNGGSLS